VGTTRSLTQLKIAAFEEVVRGVQLVEADFGIPDSFRNEAFKDADCVIHTAAPFA